MLANQNFVYVTIILGPLAPRPCAPSALRDSLRERHGRDLRCAIASVRSLQKQIRLCKLISALKIPFLFCAQTSCAQ